MKREMLASASSRKSFHVKLHLLCVSKGRGTSQIAVFSPSKLGFAKILIGSAKRPKSLVNMKGLFGRGTRECHCGEAIKPTKQSPAYHEGNCRARLRVARNDTRLPSKGRLRDVA
jgi:hypothetical protein